MRAFIAIPLSEEIRKNISSFYKELGWVKGVNPVPIENLHITLDFLGEITEKEAERFCDKLKVVSNNAASFPLVIKGVGAFPKRSEPKVLWLGMDRSKSLISLASSVKDAVDSMDTKKFSPHLTLGRVKYNDMSQNDYFGRFFREKDRMFGKMTVDRFQLMISDLSGKTPVYTLWKEFKLTGGKQNGFR